MGRFPKSILALTTTVILSSCSVNNKKPEDLQDYNNYVIERVDNLLKQESFDIKKIAYKSIKLIGINELNFFCDFFKIKNKHDFYSKVNKIQNSYGLINDGIIGPKTLKVIYNNYYSELRLSDLPFDIRKRLEIYKEMSEYYKHPRKNSSFGTILPSRVPNIFSKSYFYGINKSENISGTYINKDVYSIFKDQINNLGNLALLKKINGQFLLAVYINGKMKLGTYVSPGNPNIKLSVKTVKGRFTTTKSEMYHISGAKNSIIKTQKGIQGAIMPYALHIYKGIFAHAGYTSGKEKSHGCVRLPIFYAKGLYEIYQKYGNIEWVIYDN
ncbi:hypothetical protein CSB07_01015 [Candidatus Gracilibacteria bacterium]|nr:MAG: hypothetical protein CSB07_01015 [Candidatus Gracilibacteria bacterium]PIE85759.1 MAG: hypothetical protein CSA08_00195 [Candidatus Gracilibacteria bacterium]